MGRTEPAPLGRLAYAVGVLRLDLLGLRGRTDPHRFRGALRPLTVHAAVPGVTGRAVATGGALAGDAATHTLGRGRMEARDDRPQGFQLSENLVHLGLGGVSAGSGLRCAEQSNAHPPKPDPFLAESCTSQIKSGQSPNGFVNTTQYQ